MKYAKQNKNLICISTDIIFSVTDTLNVISDLTDFNAELLFLKSLYRKEVESYGF
jgi:hypothetical protein